MATTKFGALSLLLNSLVWISHGSASSRCPGWNLTGAMTIAFRLSSVVLQAFQ